MGESQTCLTTVSTKPGTAQTIDSACTTDLSSYHWCSINKWACESGVTLEFSRPGKPTDNAFIESFKGSFRDECLSNNWFMSLEILHVQSMGGGQETKMKGIDLSEERGSTQLRIPPPTGLGMCPEALSEELSPTNPTPDASASPLPATGN